VQIKEAITNIITIKKLPFEGGKLPCPLQSLQRLMKYGCETVLIDKLGGWLNI